MKRSVRFVLLLVVWPALAVGQEFPKSTAEGQKALDALLKQCVDSGGLKLAPPPGAKTVVLTVADAAKLQATVKAQRKLLTPALRDSLVDFWNRVGWEHAPALVALLRAVGEETT